MWATEENIRFVLSCDNISHFRCHDNNTSNYNNYSIDDYKRKSYPGVGLSVTRAEEDMF